jgi:hypothetical protein
VGGEGGATAEGIDEERSHGDCGLDDQTQSLASTAGRLPIASVPRHELPCSHRSCSLSPTLCHWKNKASPTAATTTTYATPAEETDASMLASMTRRLVRLSSALTHSPTSPLPSPSASSWSTQSASSNAQPHWRHVPTATALMTCRARWVGGSVGVVPSLAPTKV